MTARRAPVDFIICATFVVCACCQNSARFDEWWISCKFTASSPLCITAILPAYGFCHGNHAFHQHRAYPKLLVCMTKWREMWNLSRQPLQWSAASPPVVSAFDCLVTQFFGEKSMACLRFYNSFVHRLISRPLIAYIGHYCALIVIYSETADRQLYKWSVTAARQ